MAEYCMMIVDSIRRSVLYSPLNVGIGGSVPGNVRVSVAGGRVVFLSVILTVVVGG